MSQSLEGKEEREVAPARIVLPRPDHPGEQLCLQVAQMRDQRRLVAARPDQEEVGCQGSPQAFEQQVVSMQNFRSELFS